MARTRLEPDHIVVFERAERDGRHHSPWILRAEVSRRPRRRAGRIDRVRGHHRGRHCAGRDREAAGRAQSAIAPRAGFLRPGIVGLQSGDRARVPRSDHRAHPRLSGRWRWRAASISGALRCIRTTHRACWKRCASIWRDARTLFRRSIGFCGRAERWPSRTLEVA